MIMVDILNQIEYALKCAQYQHSQNPSQYWEGKVDGLYHALSVLKLQNRHDENYLDATQPEWRMAA